MSDDTGGSRKRPRLAPGDEDLTASEHPGPTEVREGVTPTTIQDLQYNASDGDICALRVQNTTFKIHRYLLSRDSVVFRDMFSSNTGGKLNEAQGEPIVLHGMVADFRDLCWAIYALPTDLFAQLEADADMSKVFRLALISNKYQFLSLEEWAIEVMIHHGRVHNFMSRSDPDFLPPLLLKAASLCGSEELREVAEEGLLQVMGNGSYDLKQVLDIMDDFGSRRLRGMAYYFLLQRQEKLQLRIHPETAALEYSIYSDPDSPGARYLDRGYCGLTKSWQVFLSNNAAPSALPRNPSCAPGQHGQICQPNWPTLFQQMRMKAEGSTIAPQLDILSRLKAIEQHLTSWPTPTPNPPSGPNTNAINRLCVSEWTRRLPVLQKLLVDTMADQFFGRAKSPFASDFAPTGTLH